ALQVRADLAPDGLLAPVLHRVEALSVDVVELAGSPVVAGLLVHRAHARPLPRSRPGVRRDVADSWCSQCPAVTPGARGAAPRVQSPPIAAPSPAAAPPHSSGAARRGASRGACTVVLRA